MKGYKMFLPDWTSKEDGTVYEVGRRYSVPGEPIMHKSGFHFCESLSDCIYYYPIDRAHKIAEISAVGKVIKGNKKYCTNSIIIVREIPWEEAYSLLKKREGSDADKRRHKEAYKEAYHILKKREESNMGKISEKTESRIKEFQQLHNEVALLSADIAMLNVTDPVISIRLQPRVPFMGKYTKTTEYVIKDKSVLEVAKLKEILMSQMNYDKQRMEQIRQINREESKMRVEHDAKPKRDFEVVFIVQEPLSATNQTLAISESTTDIKRAVKVLTKADGKIRFLTMWCEDGCMVRLLRYLPDKEAMKYAVDIVKAASLLSQMYDIIFDELLEGLFPEAEWGE